MRLNSPSSLNGLNGPSCLVKDRPIEAPGATVSDIRSFKRKQINRSEKPQSAPDQCCTANHDHTIHMAPTYQGWLKNKNAPEFSLMGRFIF